MISRKRLAEIIQDAKCIYSTWHNEVRFITPDEDYLNMPAVYLDYLFETEREAQWDLEMTATRIEKLKLPTWEQTQVEGFRFDYNIKVEQLWLVFYIHNIGDRLTVRIHCVHGDAEDGYYYDRVFTITEEASYTKACKTILSLFRGDEV